MPAPASLRALAVAAVLTVASGCGQEQEGAPVAPAGAPSTQRGATTPATTTSPAPPPEEQPARDPLRGLTLSQVAGQTVVLRFAGTSAPSYVLRALRRRRVAGVILFADNIRSPAQLRRMTRAIRRAGGGRAIVSIDQEGGSVRRIPWAAPRGPQSGLRTRAAAGATARAAARDLRAAGVNVNFAPVADVADTRRSVMRGRAFPGDGVSVARLVEASVRGYRDSGVLPTVKHFPGLGPSTINTDFAAATVRGLDSGDLQPYKAAIGSDVPLVMLSHAVYPQLDRRSIASQSREVVTELLRKRLGFKGVIVTDSLEAKAVVGRSSTPVAAARSMRAGADLMLTTGRGSYLPVLRQLVGEAERSRRFRARLRESARRVIALRGRFRPGG